MKELQGLGLRVDLVDEDVETVDAENVIASSGPEDKSIPVVPSVGDEEEDTVFDESDDIDLEEDGVSIETADEFRDKEIVTDEEAA